VVTGAASGIGAAIAERLHAEGAMVARVDRDEAALAASTKPGDRTVDVVADLGQEAEIERLVEQLHDLLPPVDVLVNAAGIVRSSPLAAMPSEEWNEVLAVNLSAPFLLSRALVPSLSAAAEGGAGASAIVNITSIEAHIVIASSGETQPHYSASKGGLQMLTKALAVELSPVVRVNAIAPGLIETPLTTSIRADESRLGYYLSRTPLGRMGRPEDIAAAAAFLASEDAAYITGSTVFVDGGWMAL